MRTAVCSWAFMKIHQKSGQTVSAILHSDLTASVKEKLKRNKSAKLLRRYNFKQRFMAMIMVN